MSAQVFVGQLFVGGGDLFYQNLAGLACSIKAINDQYVDTLNDVLAGLLDFEAALDDDPIRDFVDELGDAVGDIGRFRRALNSATADLGGGVGTTDTKSEAYVDSSVPISSGSRSIPVDGGALG